VFAELSSWNLLQEHSRKGGAETKRLLHDRLMKEET
jgi:hypothetical protein